MWKAERKFGNCKIYLSAFEIWRAFYSIAGDIHCLHFFAIKNYRDRQTLSFSSTKSLTVPSFYDGYRSDKDAYEYGLCINHTKSTTHLARSCQTTRYRMTAVYQRAYHFTSTINRVTWVVVCASRDKIYKCASAASVFHPRKTSFGERP